MLHEALMLEIYRQALNAGALPTARPRSTESANSSERCPSHDSNSSENGRDHHAHSAAAAASMLGAAAHSLMGGGGGPGVASSPNSTFPAVPQTLPAQPPSMEAYLHMVAAAAQQYGFPLGAAAAAAASQPRLPMPLPTEATPPFKLPHHQHHHAGSPTASSNHSEALDFRTNLFGRAPSAEPMASEEDDEEEDTNDGNNPLDLSVGPRKRSADADSEPDSTIGQIQVKKIFKSVDSPPAAAPAQPPSSTASLMPSVNPYLAAVAAANIFRSGQFPDWNGKNDLVVDPLEKMSDIVKGPRKEKHNSSNNNNNNNNSRQQQQQQQQQQGGSSSGAPVQVPTSSANNSASSTSLPPSTEGMSKARHNIWQSHWQNKGVASSVFRCVWCKQSFSTLEALTTHMKDSKHCGVNVPPFGNLPTANERQHQHHHHQQQQQQNSQQGGGAGGQHSHHNLRKSGGQANNSPSAAAKNAFQYRGDPPTPLPRKLVRGQNVWLGKGVEQAMQILKCMRCGESFRSLGEMTKHMQETQHYTNILSQDQSMNVKSSNSSGGNGNNGDGKDGQNSLSSEESRTLSAVLTCKVCDKAFNSLGDLSNHMAKNNHYSEPLMQSMAGGQGNRKRPAPKKREKSLPVRKLLEMKSEADGVEKMQLRNYTENAKRMSMEGGGAGGGSPALGPGIGPGGDKSDAALFAERMRQYISGVKSAEEVAKANLSAASLLAKTKSPDLEAKNGASKASAAGGGGSSSSSSVLSAIEQMFTTSFDTPPRHASLPATSPSNSSTKNTSPVASSILKRLGIDETVDYNKPLMDTSDPYYQHYRYTSSERSASECSAETHVDAERMKAPQTPNSDKVPLAAEDGPQIKKEPKSEKTREADVEEDKEAAAAQSIKMEIKAERMDDEEVAAAEREREAPAEDVPMKSPKESNNNSSTGDKAEAERSPSRESAEGALHNNNNSNNNNNNHSKERSLTPPKLAVGGAISPLARSAPRSPTDSHRSATPKSPASSIKSYDGDKKYPSDSLNALSSMFDSLGSSSASGGGGGGSRHHHLAAQAAASKIESPENLSSTSNSLAALRQFCVKKEKTV